MTDLVTSNFTWLRCCRTRSSAFQSSEHTFWITP